MFCGNCGRQIPDGARFCGGCGTPVPHVDNNRPGENIPRMKPASENRQEYQRQSYEQQPYQRQEYAYTGGGSTSSGGPLPVLAVILAAVFAVFTIVYAFGTVSRLVSAIGSLIHGFTGYFGYHMVGYGVVLFIQQFIIALLTLVIAAMCAMMAVAMFACFRSFERYNAKDYFVVLTGGSIGALLAYVLRMIAMAIFFHGGVRVMGFVVLLLVCAAAVVMYVLLTQAMGIAVIRETDFSDLKGTLADSIGSVIAALRAAPEGQRAEQWRQERKAAQQQNAGQAGASYAAGGAAYSYNDAQAGAYANGPAQPQGGGYGGAYNAGPLRTDRSTFLYFLFSIITCGIYPYYVIYTLARDINAACEGDGKQTTGLLKFIVFSFLTCGIYGWYWYYAYANRLQENAPRYGLNFSENGTSVLLWMLLGSLLCGIGAIIAINIILRNTNALCQAYNRQKGYYGA